MNVLAIGLVLLGFAWLQTPKKDTAASDKTEASKPTQPSVVTEAGHNGEPSEKNTSKETAAAPNIPHGLLEWINAASTVVIAIFAVVTALAIIVQVKVAKKSERAWLMVELEEDHPPISDGINQGVHNTTVHISFSVKNQGRTPAWITQIKAGLVILESMDSTESLPVRPNLSKETIKYGTRQLAVNEEFESEFQVTCQGDRQVGKLMVLYGIVKYRHIFSDREAHTTFGYKVTPAGTRLIRLSGHPKYNENT
jgi:hypothetical protein